MLWEQGGSIRPRTGGQRSLKGKGSLGGVSKEKELGLNTLFMPMSRPRGMNNGLKGLCAEMTERSAVTCHWEPEGI